MRVKIKQFDQHQKLIMKLISKLQNPSKKISDDIIKKTLMELSSYTRFHFTAEEQILENYHYPDLEDHVKNHLFFISKIEEFQAKYAKNESNLDEKILNFLKDWFVSHIMVEDKAYEIFLDSKGLS